MKKYELQIKNEKLRTYNLIGWILFSIQVIAFVAMAFLFEERQVRSAARFGLIGLALASVILYVLRRSIPVSPLSLLLFCCLAIWMSTRIYLPIGIAGIIFLLHNIATAKKLVRVNEEYVLYPSYVPDKIPWKKISACILKDGLLTIDQQNNKLFQHLVEEKTQIDEKEFNEFCSEQINRSN